MTTSGVGAVASLRRKIEFLDLPCEIQREIFSHCNPADWICAALVSKYFHGLASAELYRNFHIIFPDDDDLNFDSPIDGLAGGLDTFTTSNYNYAAHLRDIFMDTLSSGSRGEMSYQSYVYSASCGKFLNNLLFLTLKKAKSLEAFRWNIRVELSRPVYRELHRIPTLRKLHLRMQSGDSYYTSPPPLPLPLSIATNHSPPAPPPPPLNPPPHNMTQHWTPSPPYTADQMSFIQAPTIGPATFTIPGPSSPTFSTRGLSKHKNSRLAFSRDPSTLSGFKNLQSLSVLDIDELDSISELTSCIKNSSSTLTELQLSFSDALAFQSRRSFSDSDSEDSEVEDEYHGHPHVHNLQYDLSRPAKVFRAQESLKRQDAALGKIFDVEQVVVNKPQVQMNPNHADSSKEKIEPVKTAADHQAQFVSSLHDVSKRLMSMVNGSRERSAAHQELLDIIEKAAKTYVESASAPEAKVKPPTVVTVVTSSNPKGIEIDAATVREPVDGQIADFDAWAENVHKLSPGQHIYRSTGPIRRIIRTVPEDVADDDLAVVDRADSDGGQRLEDSVVTSRPGETAAQAVLGDADLSTASEITSTHAVLQCENEDDEKGSTSNHRRMGHIAGGSISNVKSDSEASPITDGPIRDYLRNTRGLSLESLGIHLIPVRASVLSVAINFSTLRQITLLNVGDQAPIWILLAKENKVQPLPLRSIFSDSASLSLLTFASQLTELHEMLLIERSVDYKPKSFAPRASVSIDQIRRLVLKKHIGTLKRLMVKDESKEANWDANEKTMIMICTRGTKLEELAVSMNIHAVHAFMQYFSGLASLRAINILQFKNNDTCLWVMRETLRFIVDNLSHYPHLKLEWIAMEDDRVDRVVRPSEYEDKTKPKSKRKDKAINNMPLDSAQYHDSAYNDVFPVLTSEALDSDSDSDDDTYDSGNRLRYKTVGPLQFYDVWGVKLFEKEIRSGRL